MLRGLTRGLQMLAQALSMKYRAEQKGNTACITALNTVFSIWFMEVTGTVMGAKQVDVKIGIPALLFSDPFQGSREAFRQVVAKYPEV